MTTKATAVELPPLPEPVPEPLIAFSGCYYTADRMHAYATAYALAVLAAKEQEAAMLREAVEDFDERLTCLTTAIATRQRDWRMSTALFLQTQTL